MSRIDVGRPLRENNNVVATRNRRLFAEHGVYVMNMIGSPGCGKTSILERMTEELGERLATIIGDVKTALDAHRLLQCGAKAYAIETGGACHLNAAQIATALADIDLNEVDFLVIENVGNLVCPSAFDLGENIKVAVLSVPEGDEKVRKYPALFLRADVVFINKIDLLEHCPYDTAGVRGDLHKVRPQVRVFETSATQGVGFEPWIEFLRATQRTR